MAKKAKTKMPGFAEIEQALAALPEQVEKWTKAAHKDAWKAFATSKENIGLPARFDQTANKLGSTRPGYFAKYGLGVYAWSGRRHMVPARAYRHRGHVVRKDNRPAFVKSGAMRDELLARTIRARNHRRIGGQIRTEMNMYHRSQPLWGPKRGIARIDVRKEYATYMMTVYKGPGGAANKAGPEKVWVSRLVDKAVVTPANQTYAEEWALKPIELAWMANKAEIALQARVGKAVFDAKGKIRSKFRSRFVGSEEA
jgi:hypothetical protein